MGYQTNCFHFSGYKPCGLHADCSSRCPHKKAVKHRLLIVHLEALGAVLRTTSILKPLMRKWPDAHITWVTHSRAAALLENNPLVHRIIKNDHRGMLELSNLEFDATYCVDKSLEASGVLKIPSKTGPIFGFVAKNGVIVLSNPEASELYDIGLSNVKKLFINTKPETRLVTEALALDYKRDPYVFEFTNAEKLRRDTLFKDLKLDQAEIVVGFNTGCSGTIPYKKLTTQSWSKTAQLILAQKPNAKILLLGGPEDTQRNFEIHRAIPDPLKKNVIPTGTEKGIRVGFILMDLCHVVMTGDSLGLHMAIALKKWTVGWFGPTCAHEIDYFDRGQSLMTTAECAPCWKRECNKFTMCYDLVDLEKFVSMALSARQVQIPRIDVGPVRPANMDAHS